VWVAVVESAEFRDDEGLNELSLRARVYILAVIAAGAAVAGLQFANLGHSFGAKELGLIAVAVVLASLAQFASVQGSTAKSSYDLALIVYGFVLLVRGPAAAIIVSSLACVLDWAWHRPPWYVQSFNICSLALALSAGGAIYHWAAPGADPSGFMVALGVIGAVMAVVTVNHALIGLAVVLARGESLAESGIFSGLTLAIDAALVAAGMAAALIWFINPYASVIALAPIYLISATLRVPSLERQAVTDPKTGVFNARHFQELLASEMTRASRFDRPLTIVMGDLDLLREVNNRYGHLAGDKVLIRVAEIMKSSVRDYDVVARFGGEEFTILMTETSLEQALPRIEALREAIAAARIEVPTSVDPIRTTMSFGLAERQPSDESADQLLHRADLALYKAKVEGRNCVRLATSSESESPAGEDGWPKESVLATGERAPVLTLVASAGPETETPGAEPTYENVVPEVESISAEPEQSPRTPVPRPHRPSRWPLGLLITGVGLAAVGAFGLTLALATWGPVDWLGLVAVAAVAIITEALAVNIYVRDTSVSTSTATLIAGAVLAGPVGALVVGATIAATALIKHHSPLNRFVYNASVQLLAGLGCVWVVQLLGLGPALEPAWLLLATCLFAALVAYALSTCLVATAMSVGSAEGMSKTWTQHFGWLAPYYLGLGALACCLVLAYSIGGLIGIASVITPLFVLRFAQKQYIDHTAEVVGQLKAAFAESREQAEEISTLNDELLVLLSGTLELRDPYVLGHSRHVARYAASIGKELKLPAEGLEILRKAALLHDIGKLAIPDSILAKCGPLTDLEYDQIKEHPLVGARIFVESRFLRSLLPIIRYHHERYDGHGYPTGLKGESIPLEARILSVADAAEAIASDRVYRPGSPAEMVLQEVRAGMGTQFDPGVVEALCRAVEGGSCEIVNSSAEVRGRPDGYRVTIGEDWLEDVDAPQKVAKLPPAVLQQG
jgi:diguanylate cyclase (GGDEF)-like protein/putative nucleotidyltransferase with HDIG domain